MPSCFCPPSPWPRSALLASCGATCARPDVSPWRGRGPINRTRGSTPTKAVASLLGLQRGPRSALPGSGVMSVAVKRAYEPAEPADGYRVLVDRLWPRGRSRDELRLDEWARAVAPSTALRKWFGHDPSRWHEFRSRYVEELRADVRSALLAR